MILSIIAEHQIYLNDTCLYSLDKSGLELSSRAKIYHTPLQQPCQVLGCKYSSPLNLLSYDLIYWDLQLHFQMVHSDLFGVGAAAGGADAGHGQGVPQGGATVA